MQLLQEGVGEEEAGAVSREACAAESTTEACSGRSSSEKLAVSAGKRAAVVECTSGESEIARHGKKPRMQEGALAAKSVPEAQDDVSLSLQATPVVEAIALLDTLPVGKRADELRDLLLKWRAGASCQGKCGSTFGR